MRKTSKDCCAPCHCNCRQEKIHLETGECTRANLGKEPMVCNHVLLNDLIVDVSPSVFVSAFMFNQIFLLG